MSIYQVSLDDDGHILGHRKVLYDNEEGRPKNTGSLIYLDSLPAFDYGIPVWNATNQTFEEDTASEEKEKGKFLSNEDSPSQMDMLYTLSQTVSNMEKSN